MWPLVVAFVLAGLLLLYGIFVTVINRNLVKERDAQNQQELIRSQLPAQSCGVLSPELVKATIGDDLKRNSRTIQGVAYEDGCTYTASDNSNIYASLVIKTYPSSADAAENFAKERKTRIESENRDPGSYGDEMYYSAGSFYVLDGNQTYAVATTKEGINQDNQEEFSRQLLDQVIPNINL